MQSTQEFSVVLRRVCAKVISSCSLASLHAFFLKVKHPPSIEIHGECHPEYSDNIKQKSCAHHIFYCQLFPHEYDCVERCCYWQHEAEGCRKGCRDHKK